MNSTESTITCASYYNYAYHVKQRTTASSVDSSWSIFNHFTSNVENTSPDWCQHELLV